MDSIRNALFRAAVLTFEEVGFLFPLGEENEKRNSETASVSIAFKGNFEGKMVLKVSTAVLPVLAENMLGLEDSLSDEMLRDVLGEIANIICGNALPEIAGKQAYFRLDSPDYDTTVDSSETAIAATKLYFKEGYAKVSLYFSNLQLSPQDHVLRNYRGSAYTFL